MPKPGSNPTPVLQAIVLADQVYQDRKSGKFVIAGTFSEVLCGGFPAVQPASFLYGRMVDVPATVTLRFRISDLQDGSVIGESSAIVRDHPERLRPYEFAIRLPMIPLPHAGSYAVELLWGPDATSLGAWRFEAKMVQQETGNA